ncbi:MAG TPA: efflux RND transporter periplasmic adaptor subunit [Gemmataceae bacterium]|nr:efflux RND transporter periplasmic adaptor subunit [Gemmataceae bacterium]
MKTDARPSPGARVLGLLKTAGLVTAALAGLGLFLAWMGGAFHAKVAPGVKPVERPAAAGRTLVAVERTAGPETVTAVGSVQPRRKTDVASQLLATIREVRVRPGDAVHARDVLVTLDDRDLVAQQREAVAALATAEADLVTRRADYDRVRNVRTAGSVSAEEASRVEGAFRVAETQVRRAKEAIARIEVQITHTRILAGSPGLVADRFAEPGDLATPGKPILAVYDPSDLELHVHVPESLATGLAVGQELNVRIDANGLVATAKIREVVPQAQAASRSVLVKVGLPQSSSNPVLPGMFGRAAVPVGRTERLWVTRAAVRRIGQLDLVEVAGEDGTLTRRFVRLGREAGDKAEVLAGLAAGELVALPAR